MRHVLIMLLLVVLPTAILSLLAGHAIQHKELILHRRFERAAVNAIGEVCQQFHGQLTADADRINRFFNKTVLAGVDIGAGQNMVDEICETCPLVKKVFLFMNPWGFVFPEVPEPQPGEPIPDIIILRQELLKLFSEDARLKHTKLSLHRDGKVYCFSVVPDFSEVYAGFELDVEAAMQRLELLIRENSSDSIDLRLQMTDFPDAPQDAVTEVEISDTLDPIPGMAKQPWVDEGGEDGALASGALPAPFRHIRIVASLVNEDGVRQAETIETRLTGWGILLLAIVIVASSAILVRRTWQQAVMARRRSDFVIGVSHDLRTPIASMRMLAESLVAGRVTDKEKEQRFLKTIASECERLGDMIERVLFYLRQDRRSVAYSMSPLDMGALANRVVDVFRERIQGRAMVTLEVEDQDLGVIGDAEALTKVVNNLLDNALKYGVPEDSNAAEICVKVLIKKHNWSRWVVLSVSDDGPGIPERDHKRVFERFYRGRVDGKAHVGGIGLGLWLCSDIVKEHGGRMTIESYPGAGAKFNVWLKSICGR